MPEKRYLFTPGPTPVPPQVLAALAQPVIHHRGPDFVRAYGECLERLGAVHRTANDVLLFTASGTGAFESAVSNLTSPGERAVVVSAGNFGERWASMAKAFGADLVHVRYAWGETPDPEDLRGALAEAGGARTVYLTHSETSTGVVADIEALASVARDAGALVVVDAVSSLGAVPLETDAWGIDVVVSGSQKALMTPPGLGTASVSAAALERAGTTTSPRFYFDWEQTRVAQQSLDAAFTPAVPLVLALNVALGLILEEGLEAAFERHARLGRACREGVKAMGLELFSPDDDRSAVVTAVKVPPGIDAAELLLALRDRFGVQLVGGQGELKGKILRIGHIGWFDIFDITTALSALELGLVEAGAQIERGVAAGRAMESFVEAARV
ncbi:MAG: alanine--glyoxylate aminotransferase family protein [Actinobacteria bacterium]|nr:alanine--glyoxylate aminotransferase family protein [Actinomycetota bacterium]